MGRTLELVLVAGVLCCLCEGAVYDIKPRIRREWRTLGEDQKERLANAFWTMKLTSTEEGRALYGPNFINADDATLLHACSVSNPMCDVGHFGPHFMTFHIAFLLQYERSLMSIDPLIEALPYWDMTYDAVDGAYRDDPDLYIFTDKYFGDFFTTTPDNTVNNGLFANFPMANWTADRFGPESYMAQTTGAPCLLEGWFEPPQNTECLRCCGVPDCACGTDDVYPTYLRNHDNCAPYIARDPLAEPMYGGSHEIVYTQDAFDACSTVENTPLWMSWQNCIEISYISCNGTAMHVADAPFTLGPHFVPGLDANCQNLDIYGFYDHANGTRIYVPFFHSNAHVKFGLDMLDVVTSPNDAAAFTGYHANIDRSRVYWMLSAPSDYAAKDWTFPKKQIPVGGGNPPYGVCGPFSTYDLLNCHDAEKYPDYDKSKPWLTLVDDVVNPGYPFFNLFDNCDDCDGGENGYTHAEILYLTAPERTPYTYDTLAHLYYD